MSKEFDPEDPMELVGVAVPQGDLDETLDGIVREYLLLGWSAPQILNLFRAPFFAGTHWIYREKGERYVTERVHRLVAEWSRGWLTGGHAHGQGL